MALAPVHCGVSISRLGLSGGQSPSVSLQSRRRGIALKASSKGARAASNMGHHQYTSSEETKDSVMELLKNSFPAGPAMGATAADAQKGNLAHKFKMLRQKLRDLDTHHDTMYHSSIASRLAMCNDDS